MKNMTEAVCVPVRNDTGDGEHNQLTWLWEEWEIAIAFKIGGGPRGWGGSYALYCKSGDKDGDMEFMIKRGIAMSMRMSRDFLASMLNLMSKLRKSSRMT
jgi:hypothetical protein